MHVLGADALKIHVLGRKFSRRWCFGGHQLDQNDVEAEGAGANPTKQDLEQKLSSLREHKGHGATRR
jgi:hypothetical protein